MMTLVFLGDNHDENDSINRSLGNVQINLEGQGYAVLIEEIMVHGNEHIMQNEYEGSIGVICEEKNADTIDCETLLNLMNDSNNNVYAFDADGAPESPERHNGQRANIRHVLELNEIADLNFVIVIVGDGHLLPNPEVQGWIPLQQVTTPYPNVNNIIVGHP